MEFHGCCFRRRAPLVLLAFILATCTVFAEDGVLVLVVTDTEQHPFANVQIGMAGDGGSPQFTDQSGKARLKLPSGTKPAGWVNLLLLNAPGGLDLAFISPFDSRVRVPPFDNESENYDPVVLAKRGDKAMLESGSGMLAIHAAINHPAGDQKKKTSSPSSFQKGPANLGHPAPRFQTASLIDQRMPASAESGAKLEENAVQTQDVGAMVADCTNNVSAQRRDLEKHILEQINEQRLKHGASPLQANDPLTLMARHHSCRMVALNFVDHVDPEYGDTAQRLRRAKVRFTSASENLAEEKTPSDLASNTVALWLSDEDHRENIMGSDFSCAGVGVAIKPDDTYLVTEISTAHPCPNSASLPIAEDRNVRGLAEASLTFGLSVSDIENAIKKWGGTNLTWKIVALNTSIADGTDPFVFVQASNSDVVFGVGNWSLRDCSLQRSLMEFQKRNSRRFAEIVGPETAWLSQTMKGPCKVSYTSLLQRMVHGSGQLTDTWRSRFRSLGNDRAFQHVQVEQMTLQVEKAQREAATLGLNSEQGVAFYQGVLSRRSDNPRTKLKEDYQRDIAAFTRETGQQPDEEVKLLLLMNRSIQWNSTQASSSPVKMTKFDSEAKLLALGTGVVSGRHYELDDFGIGPGETRKGSEPYGHVDAATLQKLAGGWIPGETRPANLQSSPKQ